jgi:hypothetical protein
MTAIMNSAPPAQRGAASGMRATFQNTGMVVSIGLFFSLMIVGLSSSLPSTMETQLRANGVPAANAAQIAHLPPVDSLFAAFLGYNPMQQLLGAPGANGAPSVLSQLPPDRAANLTGKEFFPHLISGPFKDGLVIAFSAVMAMCLIAAGASWMRGGRYIHEEHAAERAGPFGVPLDPGAPLGDTPEPDEWVPA